jgi:hypothetical protein
VHFLAEGHGSTGRDRDGLGTEVVLEIVYQAPFIGFGQGFGVSGNKIPDDGRFAGALNPGDEDVIAGAFHVQPEFDGLNRSLLTDDTIQRFYFRSVFEFKNSGVTDTAEFGSFQLKFFRHLLIPDCFVLDLTVFGFFKGII